jgi:predicted TIM-barrel fold metal-dependent hydrolase
VIPIVDGRHHIWRQADLPWLVGPMQPRIFGPYEPIRRDCPIEEFDAAGEALRPDERRAILHDTAMRVYRITA